MGDALSATGDGRGISRSTQDRSGDLLGDTALLLGDLREGETEALPVGDTLPPLELKPELTPKSNSDPPGDNERADRSLCPVVEFFSSSFTPSSLPSF